MSTELAITPDALPACLAPKSGTEVIPDMESWWLDTGCVVDRGAELIVVRDGTGLEGLAAWVAFRSAEPLGLDSETNAEDPWDAERFKLRTVQIADPATSWVVVVEDLDRAGLALLSQIIREHPLWVGHYARSEINFIGRGLPDFAWRFGDIDPHIADTQPLLGYYDPRTVMPETKEGIDPRIPHKRGLKEATERELSPVLAWIEKQMYARWKSLAPVGHRTPKKAIAWGFANISSHDPVYLAYAGLDPLMTIRLWHKMLTVVTAHGQGPVLKADLRTQWDADQSMFRGLPVDGPYAIWLEGQLSDLVTFNASYLGGYGIKQSGMGPAVGAAFEHMGLISPKRTKPTEKNPDGNASWDKEVIAGLVDHDNPQVSALALALQTVRKATKFIAAYSKPMLLALTRDGRVHADLRVFGTVTGRMAGRDPALQNLPKKDTRVRAAYTALPGHVLVSCDFSQGEPRTMAGLSGDLELLRVLLQGDLNSTVAAATFGDGFLPGDGKTAGTTSYLLRQKAKAAFLAWCYGAGLGRIASTLGVSTAKAAETLNSWRRLFPVLSAYADQLNAQAVVTLESGRQCPLWDRYMVGDSGQLLVRPRASRKGLNYATQGSQRDLLVLAWRRLVDWGWGWSLYFFVHDEILLSVPPFLADAASAALQAAMTFDFHGVPIECEAEINGWTWLPQPEEYRRGIEADRRELESTIAEFDEVAA